MAEKKEQAEVYTKEQIVTAKLFAGHRDLLAGALDNEKSYSVKEVEAIIKKYLEGQVV